MEGFIVRRWSDRWEEGIDYNLQLIKEVRSHLTLKINPKELQNQKMLYAV
jgi:hypothetical protein